MRPRGDLQLAIGYWIVSHKQILRTWWAISLMSFSALSLLWLVVFFPLFFSQQPGLNRLMTQMAAAPASFRLQAFQPQPLGVGPVTVIRRDEKHVDLVAEVTNGNAAWGATAVTAHFTVNGQTQRPPVAGTIPVNEAGELLLVRRAIETRIGTWVFPGGYMDLGETAEEAAIRETMEEAKLGHQLYII